ncbi:hypothetical protein ACI79G_16070 [Geodermatophilus sp. SYSU D00779]
MGEPAWLELLTADGGVFGCGPGELITIGREGGVVDVTVPLQSPQQSAVDISAVALEIFCHDTNLAVRVHQRPPGYLLVEAFDSYTSSLRRRTVGQGSTVLADGPLVTLALRLGDGGHAVEVSVGDVRFSPAGWRSYTAAEPTRVTPREPPREQWARWLVTAHNLWASDDRRVIPTEAATREAMRARFPLWPTKTPAEPARAVREALHFYGLKADAHPTWHAGLAALFAQGWPRASLVDWVNRTAKEVGWAPVGLGGRQGPRGGHPPDKAVRSPAG